ncbi:MAG: NmrA-like protein, partial [Alphaproteobacteria bacterium]|nr:NmrA-like protein [Alphaproteobacteria bacterium]
MDGTALILGGSGSFGGAVAREMLDRGWQVRLLVRAPGRVALPGAEIVQGDALESEALARAVQGQRVIVHGVNYPYHQWVPNMERVTSNVLRAARAHGATVLFPGNIYGFGAQTAAALPETAGMQPNSKKGRLRVKLETMLRTATLDGKARVLVVRAGDYFGPTVRNGLVDRVFGHAVRGKPMQVFGRASIAHQWCYVPDLARLAMDLLQQGDRRAPYEVVHDRGHVARPQLAFLRQVAAQAGKPDLKIQRVPWLLLRLAALFDPVVRELLEMRYL